MTTITWQNPPAPRKSQRGPAWLDILEPLSERPGEWAMVRTFTHNANGRASVSNFKRSEALKESGKRYEFTCRWIAEEDTLYVYARYLGGDE